MKDIMAFLCFIYLTLPAAAQKVHVWCPPQPENAVPQDTLSNRDKINLIIYDARKITDMETVKCSSDEVCDAIVRSLQSAFPGTQFNVLDPSEYRKAPSGNVTTLKIGIAAYHSGPGEEVSQVIGLSEEGFSTGDFRNNQWASLTGYRVALVTFEGTRQMTATKDIVNIVTRPAIGGLLSARKALASSYLDVFQELIKFVGQR